MFAAEAGHGETVRALVEAADAEAKMDTGCTVLMYAGTGEVAQLILGQVSGDPQPGDLPTVVLGNPNYSLRRPSSLIHLGESLV